MSKFVIINRSRSNLQLLVPVAGCDRYSCITLEPSLAIDVLPIAGSVQLCKLIPRLYDWKHRNLVDILEE